MKYSVGDMLISRATNIDYRVVGISDNWIRLNRCIDYTKHITYNEYETAAAIPIYRVPIEYKVPLKKILSKL